MLYTFLFPRYSDDRYLSLLLLMLRLVFGVLFMMHGFDKLNNYATLSEAFPRFMGLSSTFSLLLSMFAELVCAAAFLVGFLYRLAVLPMIFSMAVAFVWVHHASVVEGELAFIYLLVFLLMAITGPGRFSVDFYIDDYLQRRQKELVDVASDR